MSKKKMIEYEQFERLVRESAQSTLYLGMALDSLRICLIDSGVITEQQLIAASEKAKRNAKAKIGALQKPPILQ